MTKETYELNDLVDPLTETMDMLVSDKTTANGTGYSPVADVLNEFRAYGGMCVTNAAAPHPSATLVAGVPQKIIGWELAMPVNKDVTIDLVNGLITFLKAGVYNCFAGLSMDHNVTTQVVIDLMANGVTLLAEADAGFRAAQVDHQAIPIFHMDNVLVGDTLELQWTSAVGGAIVLDSAQFAVDRIG